MIVVAFGAGGGAIGSAAVGAAASVLAIGAIGLATYRVVARIPRRALQLFVGAMLSTFGTIWAVEGLGVHWPGDELALLWLGIVYVVGALVLVRVVAGWRRDLAPPRGAGRHSRRRADDRLALDPGVRGVPAWWLLPLAVLGATVRSLRAAVRRERA